jgi:hypothetical protein
MSREIDESRVMICGDLEYEELWLESHSNPKRCAAQGRDDLTTS